ncbi:MAG: molecular chaperone GrpE [Chitinophagales bacterium]|jgi:molecular chaperone GrpE
MANKDKETIEENDQLNDEEMQEQVEAETIEEPISELEEVKTQLAEQKEKYLRLFADFDNYKKRTAKERLDLLNTAGKDIVLSVIPVIDDFERAIAVAEDAQEVESVKEGMILIKNKMFSVLQQRGLKQMESKGEVFDTEKHEAITEIPAPNEEMKGKIIDEVEKGYTMNDKIIRYAKVVVGK